MCIYKCSNFVFTEETFQCLLFDACVGLGKLVVNIIINVYLSMSSQEYKGVTIKKMMHSKCK